MGTRISISVVTAGEHGDQARAAIAEAERSMLSFGRDGWAWGEGALGEFNRALAAGHTAVIPVSLRPLFARAWQFRETTQGRFEPRIARLVQLWGFHDQWQLGSEPPAAAKIEPLLAALHSAPVYDGGERYGPAPEVAWDLGGIGKGWIVDHTLDLLRLRGFPDALVDAGGNLAARGRRGPRSWQIGIRDPRAAASADPTDATLLASLEVQDETVNTHGDDQRFFEYRGRRYAHILDPACGEPAQGLHAVTVVHRDGVRAEAEGAALFVAGAKGWRALAARLGLEQVLAVTTEGEVRATAALAARLHAMPGVEIRIVDAPAPQAEP